MRHSPLHEKDDSRELLLAAGRKLFASKGLDGTTVRDIAKQAAVSTCLVSYHFGGKEGLYSACIEEFGKARLEFAKPLLSEVNSADELKLRLKLVLEGIAESLGREPELHKILARELEAGLPHAREVFESTFLLLLQELTDYFKTAQKKGLIRKEIDPHCLTAIIHGTIGQLMRLEHVHKRYFNRSFYDLKQQEKYLDSLLGILFEGILVKTRDKND